jgi:hypothetical protein
MFKHSCWCSLSRNSYFSIFQGPFFDINSFCFRSAPSTSSHKGPYLFVCFFLSSLKLLTTWKFHSSGSTDSRHVEHVPNDRMGLHHQVFLQVSCMYSTRNTTTAVPLRPIPAKHTLAHLLCGSCNPNILPFNYICHKETQVRTFLGQIEYHVKQFVTRSTHHFQSMSNIQCDKKSHNWSLNCPELLCQLQTIPNVALTMKGSN